MHAGQYSITEKKLMYILADGSMGKMREKLKNNRSSRGT